MRRKNAKTNPLRIAGYVWVSSQRQATEGDSLVAQQNEIEQEVAFRSRREGWEVDSIEFYVDAGRSAKNQNRPQLKRLKRDISNGKVDVVICFKLDRITRSLKDFVDLWELFADHDVDVISVREKFDTSMPTGEAMVQLIMVFAQLERKMTAERTVAIMRDRAERGLWNGGHVLGYTCVDGKLIVEDEGAAVVRSIFDGFEELGSAGAITRRLGENGVRYPVYKTRTDKVRGGNLFNKQKIIGILRNPVYIGKVCWGESEVDDCHQPLISKEQFNRVQSKIGTSTKRRTNNKKPRGRQYLLSGLLRCSCGAHMVGYSTHGRNKVYFYYQCTRQSHEAGKTSCNAPRIPAKALEEAVIGRIRDIGQHVEAREKIVDRAIECLAGEGDRLKQEEEIVRRQQQQTQADIKRLVDVLKSLGANGLESVESELRQLEKDRKELKRRLKEIQESQAPAEQISADAKAFVEAWEDVGAILDAATPDEQAQVLRHYVEVLELHPSEEDKGLKGTYVLKLFPEVRPDRGFDWQERRSNGNLPQEPTKNGTTAKSDNDPDVLTEDGLVCMTVGKAPRVVLYANMGSLSWGPFISTTYVDRRKSSSTRGTPFRPFRIPNANIRSLAMMAWSGLDITSRFWIPARSRRGLNWPVIWG
ncbi:MAG: recombinase family protein [Planctomycetaceae bacterium]|nr:recombinase family protein [Planctomycetaceae bacterium]